MKRLILIIVVFFIQIAVYSQGSKIFRNVEWGMSQYEVSLAENISIKDPNKSEIVNYTEIGSCRYFITYKFTYNKLYEISIPNSFSYLEHSPNGAEKSEFIRRIINKYNFVFLEFSGRERIEFSKEGKIISHTPKQYENGSWSYQSIDSKLYISSPPANICLSSLRIKKIYRQISDDDI